MTSYGSIPTEPEPPPSSSKLQIISRVQDWIQSSLGMRRPWKEMMELNSLNFPSTFGESVQRIKINAAFFRTNYVIITLFILFLSLLSHPVSLIVLTATVVAWIFLYFLRDGRLMILGIVINDQALMLVLLIATILELFFTNVTDYIMLSLFLGILATLAHGALRNTQDLFFVDGERGFGTAPMMRSGDGEIKPLKNAASSTFSTF